MSHDHSHDGECSGCSGRDIIAESDAAIEERGVNFSCVFGDRFSPGFVYTEGLSEKRKTDLIFVGDHSYGAASYLFGFVQGQLEGDAIVTPGLYAAESAMNPYSVDFWVIDADDKISTHAYGTESRLTRIGSDVEPKLLQVVVPDKSGRFPWEPGYNWLDQDVTNPPVTGAS